MLSFWKKYFQALIAVLHWCAVKSPFQHTSYRVSHYSHCLKIGTIFSTPITSQLPHTRHSKPWARLLLISTISYQASFWSLICAKGFATKSVVLVISYNLYHGLLGVGLGDGEYCWVLTRVRRPLWRLTSIRRKRSTRSWSEPVRTSSRTCLHSLLGTSPVS